MATTPDPCDYNSRKSLQFTECRLFAYALGVSLAFHILVLMSFIFLPSWGMERWAPALQVKLESSPAPRKFIKRPPPSQRPLARSSQPQLVQRPLARKVSPRPVPRMAMSPTPFTSEAPQAGMPGVGGGAGGGTRGGAMFSAGKGSGGLLGMGIGPGGGVPSRHIGPKFQAGAVEGSRTGEGEIDLGVEMLDVKALDTGRHRALVITDPKDKLKLKGFLYLSSVYSESIERAEQGSSSTRRQYFTASASPLRRIAESETLHGLADKMSEQTQVKTQVLDGVALDDPRLAQVPFVLFTVSSPFTFSEAEATNLGRYLVSGGFVYVEVVTPVQTSFHSEKDFDLPSLRAFLRQAFRLVGYSEGKDWQFVKLESSHPLYHCYYDLDALPRGFRDMWFWYWSAEQKAEPSPDYLEGIQVGRRLAGVYSMKNYADFWAGLAERVRGQNKAANFLGAFEIGGEELGPYRLGINILVYALTQEGSLAQKLVSVE